MTTAIQVKERPIPFSGDMVRAILGGRKTQTRRVVKLSTGNVLRTDLHPGGVDKRGVAWFNRCPDPVLCPYGAPGDRLWVRENIYHSGLAGLRYRADDEPVLPVFATEEDEEKALAWTEERPRQKTIPFIHMPRWASRILLEVVSVRVDRLQDIREADAKAEGANPFADNDWASFNSHAYREGFEFLWDHINAKRAPWESNPWVWVIEFKRVHS